MLIQTLPPRLMCRVIAIRADSICRLVTYAGSSAWMPYSPNVTRVPPLAGPERFGWCCLRCLTRRGISIGSALLGRAGLGGLGCLRGSGRLGGDGGLDRLGGSSSRRLDRRGRSRGTAIARRVAGARRVGPWPFSALVASAQRGLGGLLLAGHELVALVDPDL